MSTIKLNVTVDHQRFYNKESMWGVFGVIPNDNEDKIETLDHLGVFVISGSSPQLQIGGKYNIEIEPSYHKRYGKGYNIVAVNTEKPRTVEDQQAYLQMMVTPKQYEEIIKAYPNERIIDLMENDEFDYSKVKGIKEATYQKIKTRVLENIEIQEALVKLKDLKISFPAMKKLVDHFGSAEIVVQKVDNNIYELCNVNMFGFKKVDEYAMNRGDKPNNKNRISAAILYTLEQDAKNGHSWMKKSTLIKNTAKLLRVEMEYIEDVLNDSEKEDNTKIYMNKDKVSLKKNYYYEKTIKDKILELVNKPSATNVSNIDNIANRLEERNGFSYTEEQMNAINKAINNNFLVINGRAGVGKTTVVKGILEALGDYSYMTCALSGKAANVLSQNGLEAKTIHKMLGVDHEGAFKHNKESPMPYDIVVLDEASMANNYLIYSIVTALKDNAKFIMIGDNGQLPSIGTGAVFDDVLKADNIPRQELTIVQRQAKKSGILSLANQIRDGVQVNNSNSYETKVFGELKDMVLIPTDRETDIKKLVLDISKKFVNKDIREFQVITGRVDSGDLSVKNLNNELQKMFNDMNKPFVKRGGYEYRVGDKIIQNGNNYEALTKRSYEIMKLDDEQTVQTTSVFNGTMGKIIDIVFDYDKTRQNHKVFIEFEDVEDIIVYEAQELQQISLAYAITTHRSQGSTIKNVLFAFDYTSFMLLNKEFVYTGITRASNGCVLIAENDALRMAINKTGGSSRRTFLYDFLKE